jgi:hypothetical protein
MMEYVIAGLVAAIALLLFTLILAMRDAIAMAQQAREAQIHAARCLAMFQAATMERVRK